MSRIISSVLAVILVLSLTIPVLAEVPDNTPFDVKADSALLMDQATGEVLYAKNAEQALPPASVTKIMTLLLFMEEVDKGNISLDDDIQVSEYAASMAVHRYFSSLERR